MLRRVPAERNVVGLLLFIVYLGKYSIFSNRKDPGALLSNNSDIIKDKLNSISQYFIFKLNERKLSLTVGLIVHDRQEQKLPTKHLKIAKLSSITV